jgi:transcription elongation GreA/GreB family factor
MGGKDAKRPTVRGQKAAIVRAHRADGHTRQALYAQAQQRHIEGRSKMTKRQLENALGVR